MGFESRLVVTEGEGGKWRLRIPLIYRGKTDRFLVPTGFLTDFASVPRLLWPILPPYGPELTKASVVHDWLYTVREISRKDADGIFGRILKEEGSPVWRRSLMWAGVRLGGWWTWGKRERFTQRERRV